MKLEKLHIQELDLKLICTGWKTFIINTHCYKDYAYQNLISCCLLMVQFIWNVQSLQINICAPWATILVYFLTIHQ